MAEDAKAAERRRLAEALRANLKRRKAASRPRRAEPALGAVDPATGTALEAGNED